MPLVSPIQIATAMDATAIRSAHVTQIGTFRDREAPRADGRLTRGSITPDGSEMSGQGGRLFGGGENAPPRRNYLTTW
jgi:hypothetical protein